MVPGVPPEPSGELEEGLAVDGFPQFMPTNSKPFKWGKLTGDEFTDFIDGIYFVTTSWSKNLFLLPSGKFGKEFCRQKTILVNAFATAGPMESVAFKALAVMGHLLLQKPHHKSRSKDHNKALSRRLAWWTDGDFPSLFAEADALQKRHKKDKEKSIQVPLHRRFANLVFQDRMHDALRLLVQEAGTGGVHKLTDEVVDTLRALQFDPTPVVEEALLRTGEPPECPQPVIFEVITAEAIKQAAAKLKGSHGPSGEDAENLKKQLLSFGPSSHALCEAIAAATRRLCSTPSTRPASKHFSPVASFSLKRGQSALEKASGGHGESGIVEPLWRPAGRL